jgi:hypothetical protein
MASRKNSDEAYVIDICDEVLGLISLRQHRFDFLRGDSSTARPHGVRLPVDAYYEDIGLVIEYRERQHSEAVVHFDKPGILTISGCDRGEQRRRYDQRRRDVLPTHGIVLIEIDSSSLARRGKRKLARNREADLGSIRQILAARPSGRGA